MGIISNQNIKNLPEPVQKYLKYAQVIGKEKIKTAFLKQKGFFRIKEGQKWMPFEAEDKYNTDEISFSWRAKIKTAPFLVIKVVDEFVQSKSRLLVKILSFIKIADQKGREIDQGELLRFLSEIVWFPIFFADERIKWEQIDELSARATIKSGNVAASGVFYFNKKGQIIKFAAERYRIAGKEYPREKWGVVMGEYKEVNGILMPIKGSAV